MFTYLLEHWFASGSMGLLLVGGIALFAFMPILLTTPWGRSLAVGIGLVVIGYAAWAQMAGGYINDGMARQRAADVGAVNKMQVQLDLANAAIKLAQDDVVRRQTEAATAAARAADAEKISTTLQRQLDTQAKAWEAKVRAAEKQPDCAKWLAFDAARVCGL